MKQSLLLTENELVAYLAKTSLPTILVEGTTDAYIYRILERKLDVDAPILPCGGRDKLLSVFERRNEFHGSRVLFLADSDMWLFSGVPEKYKSGVIFTKGYSIENDIYQKDIVEGLLSQMEKSQFSDLIHAVSLWFGHEVEKFLTTGSCNCGVHINKVAPNEILCPLIKSAIEQGPKPKEELVRQIASEYNLKLRGKTLFEAVLRFLSNSKRQSKYSYYNLCELSISSPNNHLIEMLTNINKKLG